MDEINQPQEISIPPAPETPISSEPTGKKGPAIFVAVLVLLLIGGVVFYFGLKSRNSSEEPSPTPTTSATSTPTPNEETDKSPTPTKKPSVTPTPKPTATSTPTPTIASQSMTITSTASLDGWRSSNGGGNTTWYIEIGRNGTLTSRGFVSFDISSIPSGKTIDEVTLRLYQVEVVGTPYSSIGSLIVDHLNYGDSLGSDDLTASAISSNVGTLTSNASVEWKDLVVTNPLKADISASRTRSQYRLRFSTEATGTDAWARFESADNYKGTGNLPQLVVKYH